MKKEIEIPDGYEIDVLTFKKVEKKLPMSWSEVTDKRWIYNKEFNALDKLLQLRDIYNDGWVADWTDQNEKYVIDIFTNRLEKNSYWSSQKIMSFKTEKLRDLFFETFKDLLTIAKPLL